MKTSNKTLLDAVALRGVERRGFRYGSEKKTLYDIK